MYFLTIFSFELPRRFLFLLLFFLPLLPTFSSALSIHGGMLLCHDVCSVQTNGQTEGSQQQKEKKREEKESKIDRKIEIPNEKELKEDANLL